MAPDVTIVQSGRWLALDSPLGANALIPTSFRGEEGLSRLFSYEIGAISPQQTIAAADLLGKSATLSVNRPSGGPRYFNGVVTRFSAGPVLRSGYRQYRLTLSPSLWLLDRTSDCRIFQSKSVKEIATTLFGDAGLSDYKFQLQGGATPREYCVQYGESDFAFLSRLFEAEGIFYFFTHKQGSHTLVIADQTSAYAQCDDAQAAYRQAARPQAESLHRWEPGWSYISGKWTLRDYDFEKPTVDLTGSGTTVLDVSAFRSWERYDYPGRYAAKSDGDARAKLRMEADEATYAVATGAGTYSAFSPGAKFTLAEHEVAAEQGEAYVLVSVRHEAADNTHFTAAPDAGEPYYRNEFTCQPATVVFRPPPATPRPVMRGPQNAVVVGPSGDEIHCDKYGRVRVQFPWDRLGKNDDTSSCWLRVAQSLSGRKWGSLYIPRVGMEVLVDFLDGDPDRPLVTGTVYNADNMPPWDLPDNKTRTGLVTRSSAQGQAANANELRFEDKKGEEQILIHAEKDFLREVENDDTLTVGHDQSVTVTNNRTATVSQGNDATTVSQGNQTVTVSQGDRTVTVTAGKQSVTVHGNLATTVETGNCTTTVSQGNHATSVQAGKLTIDAVQGIQLTCGSNSITIDQQGVTVTGMKIAIKGDMQVDVEGTMTTLKGNATVTIQGGLVKIN